LLDEFLNAQQQVLFRDDHQQNKPESFDQSLSESELTLVDESEFEDWLAVEEMSKRIERQHEELLAILTAQLSQMIHIDDAQRDNIVVPLNLCSSFNSALCAASIDSETRALIYPGLEEGLQQYLGQFYQQLSQELSELGYPASSTQAKVGRVNRKVDGALETGSIESDGQLPDADESKQPQSNSPQQSAKLDSLTRMLQTMQMATPGMAQVWSSLPAQAVPVVDSVEEARQVIDNLVPVNVNRNESIQLLQEQILSDLLGDQNDPQVIDQQKSTTLGTTTQIFESLKSQTNSQTCTSYIQQLQLPFLHYVLTSADSSKADVVQQIIDLLDQVISLIGHSNKSWAAEIREKLSVLVQRIVRDSATRPEVFADAKAKLHKYADVAQRNRRKTEKKLIETCEGQQRVRKSKRLVNQKLDEMLGGKKVPVVVPRLLKIGWRDVMSRTELRDGSDSDQWQRITAVIENLMTWLAVTDGLHSVSVSEQQVQGLLDLVNEQLSEISVDVGKQNNIIAELVALLIGTGTPRVLRPTKLMKIKPKAFSSPTDGDGDQKCQWIDSLRVGDWFEFVIGKNRKETLKLLWLGTEPWMSVFVNQRGVKRFEFNRRQLIERYQEKLVNKTNSPDQPIATRAKHAVVEKVYSGMRHNSLLDPRVDLPNSKGLLTYLRETEFKSSATLIVVEIDDYRVISQACGMEASDEIVKEIAKRMRLHSSNHSMLARIDDQSLAMVLPDTSVESFYSLASGWSEGIRREPFIYQDQSFPVVLSIGIIGFTRDTLQVDQLVKNVAVTCASAKQSGRNHIKLYSDKDRQLQQRAEQLEWAGHIDKTLAENRLVLACQPIVQIEGYSGDNQNDISGQHYEILLRVLDSKGRIGPPGSFLSAGEQLRRMPDIDRWVISNLMQWMDDHLDLVARLDGFSVNLSGQSVASESFLNFVTEQVFEVNFDPSMLTFEITETVAIYDFDYVKKFIQHMSKLGCKFSLDDFGSGYASYSYLRNLDVNYLKIDGQFVKDMHHNSKDLMMVKSMNDIAHSLRLKTIAEFVENNEILTLLGEIGVDHAQGYHIGKPSPISELIQNDQAAA